MQKKTARRILAAASAVSRRLNEALAAALETDPDGAKGFRSGVGEVLWQLFESVMVPVYREHRDLIPPELDLPEPGHEDPDHPILPDASEYTIEHIDFALWQAEPQVDVAVARGGERRTLRLTRIKSVWWSGTSKGRKRLVLKDTKRWGGNVRMEIPGGGKSRQLSITAKTIATGDARSARPPGRLSLRRSPRGRSPRR